MFGVETFSENILSLLNRRVKSESIRKAIVSAKSYGIRTIVGMMIGCPGQTLELMQRDIETLKRLEPDVVKFSIFNVLPGTAMHRLALNHNILSENIAWGDTTRFTGPPLGLPTMSEFFSRRGLQTLQKELEGQFAQRN